MNVLLLGLGWILGDKQRRQDIGNYGKKVVNDFVSKFTKTPQRPTMPISEVPTAPVTATGNITAVDNGGLV